MSRQHSLKTNSLLLGAALAGLSGISTEADGATVVHMETTDFSDSLSSPTYLTSIWTDFVSSGGIQGELDSTGDFNDVFTVSAIPGTNASIPFSGSYSEGFGTIFYIIVYDGNGALEHLTDATLLLTEPGEAGSTFLNFTVPASGLVTFEVGREGGAASYTLGATVPEAGTSAMGLAAMAAAALRRRRRDA